MLLPSGYLVAMLSSATFSYSLSCFGNTFPKGRPGVVLELVCSADGGKLHSRAVPQEKFAASVLNYKAANIYLGGHLKSPKYILQVDCTFKFTTGCAFILRL